MDIIPIIISRTLHSAKWPPKGFEAQLLHVVPLKTSNKEVADENWSDSKNGRMVMRGVDILVDKANKSKMASGRH
jgi:hypothetical protein